MNSLWPLILVALVLVGSLNPNSPCPAQEVAAQHAGAARGWVQVSLPNSLPSDGIDDENTAEIVILNARLELPGAPEVKQSRLDIRPTALAIRDGRISAVGSDDEIRAWISKDHTRVVEAGGRSVAPARGPAGPGLCPADRRCPLRPGGGPRPRSAPGSDGCAR